MIVCVVFLNINKKVAAMVLPDYKTGRNERDIQVRNVSLDLDNGKRLLDAAEVKFSYKRRYGLVGKNGIGKTTLLKAIAAFEVEGEEREEVGKDGKTLEMLVVLTDVTYVM